MAGANCGLAFDERRRRRTPQSLRTESQTVKLPLSDGSDVRFSRLPATDEVLQTSGYHIVQDEQGFSWFATRYGLYRYDGYKVKVFAHGPGNRNSLSGIEINSIFRGRDGAFWIGCAKFLDKLDPKSETFTRYRISEVTHVSQEHDGILWPSSLSAGVYRLNPHTGQIRHYTSDPRDPSTLCNNQITCTGEDREGTFWVASKGSLGEFDGRTGKVKRHIPLLDAPYGFRVYEDRLGIFWMFHVSPEPLRAFDRKTGKLTRYSFPEADAVKRVTAMIEDHKGIL
jgi:hypothetical protein